MRRRRRRSRWTASTGSAPLRRQSVGGWVGAHGALIGWSLPRCDCFLLSTRVAEEGTKREGFEPGISRKKAEDPACLWSIFFFRKSGERSDSSTAARNDDGWERPTSSTDAVVSSRHRANQSGPWFREVRSGFQVLSLSAVQYEIRIFLRISVPVRRLLEGNVSLLGRSCCILDRRPVSVVKSCDPRRNYVRMAFHRSLRRSTNATYDPCPTSLR